MTGAGREDDPEVSAVVLDRVLDDERAVGMGVPVGNRLE
jgi:hypothetical protein